MTDAWDSAIASPADAAMFAAVCFVAGLVRGFSGFALSALVMAMMANFIAPVLLIPILWFQEMTASLLMARGGWRDADRRLAAVLVVATWVGWPLGLYLTLTLPVEQSKLIALGLILALSALLLARARLPGLHSPAGPVIAGVAAGVVSGLAHVGGMMVALYVLAQGHAARNMRGTLVLFLFASSLGSFVIQAVGGVMTMAALWQGLLLAPVTALGVWLGARMFSPRWEPYYRPFCLGLLIFLSIAGIARLGLAA